MKSFSSNETTQKDNAESPNVLIATTAPTNLVNALPHLKALLHEEIFSAACNVMLFQNKSKMKLHVSQSPFSQLLLQMKHCLASCE